MCPAILFASAHPYSRKLRRARGICRIAAMRLKWHDQNTPRQSQPGVLFFSEADMKRREFLVGGGVAAGALSLGGLGLAKDT